MIEPNLVLIQGGAFWMGSNCGYHDEAPTHLVQVYTFHIGQYPVTQKQWEAVMGSNPSKIKGPDLPVINVSWEKVQEFLARLNKETNLSYRLPTEAEWEFAARGGVMSKGFKYAGSDNPDEVARHCLNSGKKPCMVGRMKPNELGLYDMSGNVWEWCQDWYGEYPSSRQTNPKGPDTGKWRILRGGPYWFAPRFCYIANRGYLLPDVGRDYVGFRLAHDFETFINQ